MMEDLQGRGNTAAGRYWGRGAGASGRKESLGNVHLRGVRKDRQEYSDAVGKTQRDSQVMKEKSHKAWHDCIHLQSQDVETKAERLGGQGQPGDTSQSNMKLYLLKKINR